MSKLAQVEVPQHCGKVWCQRLQDHSGPCMSHPPPGERSIDECRAEYFADNPAEPAEAAVAERGAAAGCQDCDWPVSTGNEGTIFTHCFALRAGDYLGQRLCHSRAVSRLRACLAELSTLRQQLDAERVEHNATCSLLAHMTIERDGLETERHGVWADGYRCGSAASGYEASEEEMAHDNPYPPPAEAPLSPESRAALDAGLADARAGRVAPFDLTEFHLHGELKAVSREATEHAEARAGLVDEVAALKRDAWAVRVLDAWRAERTSRSWTMERGALGASGVRCVVADGYNMRRHVVYDSTAAGARIAAAEALVADDPSLLKGIE